MKGVGVDGKEMEEQMVGGRFFVEEVDGEVVRRIEVACLCPLTGGCVREQGWELDGGVGGRSFSVGSQQILGWEVGGAKGGGGGGGGGW